MPEAQRRIPLTRSERKVLADLQLLSDEAGRVVISSRQLTETTGLSRQTVLSVLQRLADLKIIRTFRPPRPKTCEHWVIDHSPGLLADGPKTGRSLRSKAGGRA